MGEELTIKQQDLVTITEGQGLDKLIKPLVNEIHLFDSFVAGTSYLEDKSVLDDIAIGDILILRREENRFDDNAIEIYTQADKKLGYVPERDNIIFARLMDAGKCLQAKITNITKKGTFTKISIGIFLVDF